MNDEKIANARMAFDAGQVDDGLSLLRQVSANASSPEDIRQAFAILQSYLSVVPPRELISTLAPLPERPHVSVILPTKDRPQMLAYALQSLAAQTWKDWECIVINDGGCSVDQVVNASPARGRVVRLINDESLGQAAARNLAIDRAEGDILCFLDDDDCYAPNHLASIAGALGGTRRSMCYTGIEAVLERVEEGMRHDLTRCVAFAPPRFSFPLLQVCNYMPTVSWGIRTECLRKTGGFDEIIPVLEDWELLLRLSRQWDFTEVDAITAEYRLREMHILDSVSKNGRDAKGAIERIYARNPSNNAVVVFARKLYQWLVVTGNFAVAAT